MTPSWRWAFWHCQRELLLRFGIVIVLLCHFLIVIALHLHFANWRLSLHRLGCACLLTLNVIWFGSLWIINNRFDLLFNCAHCCLLGQLGQLLVQSWFLSAAPAASPKIQNPWGGKSLEIHGQIQDFWKPIFHQKVKVWKQVGRFSQCFLRIWKFV